MLNSGMGVPLDVEKVDAVGLHGSEGATGVASVKTARSFPMSNRAKAKPISDNGSASGITCLRRGKRYCRREIAAGDRSENT